MQLRPGLVANTRVCAKFFSFVLDRSNNYLYQPGTPGKPMVVDIANLHPRKTPKEDTVVQFMAELSQYYQLSPDSNFIFLPFPSRRDVHAIMNAEVEPSLHCGYPYFLKTWRANSLITHIKLRKHLRFALCDECVAFREAQLKANSHAELLALKDAQLQHHKEVKLERQKYYIRRDRGIDPLRSCMSMIVDAADQRLYALPYFYASTHSSQKCLRLPVHLMGTLVHGEAVHAATYFENFKQGTNVTIEAINYALGAKLQRDGKLPDRLYLQLDNTSKQCKSKYMLGYLGYLVHRGHFKRITVSFLPVGHTHEDIDQFFSRLATYLKCHSVMNTEQLHEAIRRCYQTKEGHRATTEHWDRCANFSEWIMPYLSNFDGIASFRQFRFFNNDEHGVVVQCRRKTCHSQEWAGLQGQDEFTPVFKREPPATMVGVPPTQRRELLDLELVAKQKASIEELARARRVEADVVADVLHGVDMLGDDAELPFAWDLSAMMNFDADAYLPPADAEDVDERLDGIVPAPYKFSEGQVILIRPAPGADERFYLGEILTLGVGERLGEYEVWWLEYTTGDEWMGYQRRRANRKKMTDWQWAEACQCVVLMTGKPNKTRNVYKRSQKEIRSFLVRWEQENDDEDSGRENSDPEVEDGNDSD